MLILAIETSCDETSAAIVKDGTEILSNVVSSQTEFHKKYGGIVPEVAARKHIEAISPVIKEAFDRAGKKFGDIDAVAVTFGPGLPGSLIVGLSAAKTFSVCVNKPLIGVNHLEGHIYSSFLPSSTATPSPRHPAPFISLIVSGGHTQLVLVKDHCEYKTLGRTRDDAAGEAFDKVARFLGLGYPGGPIIDKLAKEGNPSAIDFKRPMIDDSYDFSFSGIKTAVVYYVKGAGRRVQGAGGKKIAETKDIVASFQKAIVDTLVGKAIRAAKEYKVKTISLAGGVSANSELRKSLQEECNKEGIKCIMPSLEYCTDNAAMIGCAGYYRFNKGFTSGLDLGIESTARI